MSKYVGLIVLGVFLGRGMGVFPVTPDQGGQVALVVAFLGLSMCVYLWKRYGYRIVLLFLIIGILGVVVEFIGITTCIPYGCFNYTQLVGPRFFGTFPIALLFIWPLLVFAASSWLPRKSMKYDIILGSVLLIGLDFFLDPVAVHQGVRLYAGASWWYGVPWTNFLGWIPISLCSLYLMKKHGSVIFNDQIFQSLYLILLVQYAIYLFYYII